MRVPVTGYSLDIGKAHTDFAEAKLQQRLVERKLSDEEINQLAVVAMAGATAEAMNYDQVCAQPSYADHVWLCRSFYGLDASFINHNAPTGSNV